MDALPIERRREVSSAAELRLPTLLVRGLPEIVLVRTVPVGGTPVQPPHPPQHRPGPEAEVLDVP